MNFNSLRPGQYYRNIETFDEAKMFVFYKILKMFRLQMCYIINGEIFMHSHCVSQRGVPHKDVILAAKYPIFFDSLYVVVAVLSE
jgi:hypothetical protein